MTVFIRPWWIKKSRNSVRGMTPRRNGNARYRKLPRSWRRKQQEIDDDRLDALNTAEEKKAEATKDAQDKAFAALQEAEADKLEAIKTAQSDQAESIATARQELTDKLAELHDAAQAALEEPLGRQCGKPSKGLSVK